MESQNNSQMLLITANVGTIFEQLDQMLTPWLSELTKKVDSLRPAFIALHMQELGGKNYKTSMQLISPFFKTLLSHPIIQPFNRYLIIVDSDFTDEINFTSLCNIYLIHKDLKDIELFDFEEHAFTKLTSRKIFSGNLKSGKQFVRERYPKDYFREFQWSRKGYIQTKWKIEKHVYDLVNIHLFHDASNLISLKSSPSVYSQNRKRAFEYSIKRILANESSSSQPAMFLIFGDFNFRLDQGSFVKEHSNLFHSIEHKNSENKLVRLECKSKEKKNTFTVEEKKFKWHLEEPIQKIWKNMLKHDIELSLIDEPLYELEKTFPPSYPFMEQATHPDSYNDSRCPAWCDRIIFNKNLRHFLDEKAAFTEYGEIGQGVCMGDHKPIYLFINVRNSEKVSESSNPVKNVENSSTAKKINHQYFNDLHLSSDYVYLNHNYVNIHHAKTDIHDYAVFNNFNILCLLRHEANYQVNNLTSATDLTSLTNLNQWLQSIIDTHQKLNRDNVCLATGISSHCDCIAKSLGLELLLDSVLVRFFLQTLNGNFFKLKHLCEFLSRLLDESFDLSKVDPKRRDSEFKLVLSDFLKKNEATRHETHIFDSSFESYRVLNEIMNFLNAPCTVSLFKTAVIVNNSNKNEKTPANEQKPVTEKFRENDYDENFNVKESKKLYVKQ